jgi:hypothetical protein
MHFTSLFLLACTFVMSVGACSPGTGSSSADGTDTASQAQSTDTAFNLKPLMITSEYVFPDGENVRGTKMDDTAISKFKPGSIDEFYVEGDTYFVADTISRSTLGSVYFIVKNDPNEVSGWLVIYDTDMQVKDQIEIYYENAEGNFYLTSSILDNIVTAAGENITPEENPVSAFRIVAGPRWEIIEH